MGVCCSDSARLYDYEPNIVEYEIGKLLKNMTQKLQPGRKRLSIWRNIVQSASS